MLKIFSNVILRSPLQSLQRAYKFSNDVDTIMHEGIYLASNEFYNEYEKKSKIKSNDKLEMSFSKYWLRSCTRSTPFGTFAGTSLLDVNNGNTSIVLNENNNHRRAIRIDMNYFSEIVHQLIEIPKIQNKLKYYPNNSIYELNNSYRYIEYYIIKNKRKYDLCSVPKTKELKNVLEYAKRGVSIVELINYLLNSTNEFTENEVKSYILSLCEAQLLQSDFEPSVTGKDPLENLIDKVKELDGLDEIVLQLKKIQSLINYPSEGVSHFKKIEIALGELGISVTVPKNILQVDLFLSLQSNNINKDLIQNIANQVNELLVLSQHNRNIELSNFKKSFSAKFEGMEVPLSIALDSEIGIGYAGKSDSLVGNYGLVNDLILKGQNQTNSIEINKVQEFILFKYHEYLHSKKDFIEISPIELNELKQVTDISKIPNSLYIMGSLIRTNNEIDKNNFTFDFTTCSGPSAANLLGRFAHGQNEILQFAKEILRKEEEERPDAIYAEIVHLPQARLGNILLRPILREYEIAYVGFSGAPSECQIYLDDIMVSIRDGDLILRSKKLNKQIIPRLTTAHGFSYNSLPVYKFLCDLQYQGVTSPSFWDWTQLGKVKYFPKVIFKNLVVKKAQWKIEESDITDLPNQPEAIYKFFLSFRMKFKIPEKVVYSEMDNKLLIDFEEKMGIDIFLHYLKRYKKITIEEFLFNDDNCIVKNIKEEPFANELIIPVYRDSNIISNKLNITKVQQLSVKRKFPPFSEWLYFKIYTGPKTAENILKTNILKFIEDGISRKMFEKFFFIRYKDDSSHIRLRFYNTDISKQIEIYKRIINLLEPLLSDFLIDKINIDTYVREVERYGENVIEEVESLFFNDSLAILKCINLFEEDSEKYRVLIAIRCIDMFLLDFDFSLKEKRDFSKKMSASFFIEFGGHLELQRQLNEKYRIYQKQLFSFLNKKNDFINEIEEAISYFEIRSEMNKMLISQMYSKIKKSNIEQDIFEIIASLIHMFMNRFFIGNQRKYELVLYHFLEKYYSSQLAIEKK